MRKSTRHLLWLFVFSVPWEFVPLPGVGAVTRLLGIFAISAGALTTVVEGRVRKPPAIFWCAAAFTLWSFLTLLWTVNHSDSLWRVSTYAQLLASVWLVSEFSTTRQEHQSLIHAFCLGAFVPAASLFINYASGLDVAGTGRYAASGFGRINGDDLGLTLALGLPLAWYLLLNGRGAARLTAAIYCPVGILGVLLTGTRSAFLAAIVALGIIPLTLPLKAFRNLLLALGVSAITVAAAATIVPSNIWGRMSTIRQELAGAGDLSGRVDIWKAGVRVFLDRPVLGFGTGAFGTAVADMIPEENMRFAHNALLAIAVEQGAIGLAFFSMLLGACAWAVVRLRPPERTVWIVLMLAWFVGVMALNWDYRKLTWLLFGLLAAEESGRMPVRSPSTWPSRLQSAAAKQAFHDWRAHIEESDF